MILNDTHDPRRESWVQSANDPKTDFPIQNLPFGIFSTETASTRRVGIAIGDEILDVSAAIDAGMIDASAAVTRAAKASSLNGLMSSNPEEISALRASVSDALEAGNSSAKRVATGVLTPIRDVTMHLPATIGDYTDFYASIHHATNVGRMFRPDNPLLPNYKHVPIGYHGRASSIVVSGTSVRRPFGQTKPADSDEPFFGATKMLDYESELGFLVGRGNKLGEPIGIDDAQQHIFGFCLVNDWSARDIQSWEYQPLGPFLAKNFATTISPWIVTGEALEPYRTRVAERPEGDPKPLGYLRSSNDESKGGIEARLEVYLSSQQMKKEEKPAVLLSRASFAGMYWSVAQMLTHHASNGCNLETGDLLASGTVSGESDQERGCLLELTSRGSNPVKLPTGEERRFLEDGDEIVMKGFLEASGRRRIGFGECRGTILPALRT